MRYLLLLTALLAACATPGDLRQGPPAAALTSTKPVADVAACIVDGWERTPWPLTFNAMPVSMQTLSDRTSIQLREGNLLAAMVDIRQTPAGSSIAYYAVPLKASASYAEEQVRRCQ